LDGEPSKFERPLIHTIERSISGIERRSAIPSPWRIGQVFSDRRRIPPGAHRPGSGLSGPAFWGSARRRRRPGGLGQHVVEGSTPV